MDDLIKDFEQRFTLGMPQMDKTHAEFVELINRLGRAEKEEFVALFPAFVEHTRNHFDSEQTLMEGSRFPATGEHWSEHQRVLGELTRFGEKVAAGSTQLGRAYIREQLAQWFEQHTLTMDSALAAHLKYTMAQVE